MLNEKTLNQLPSSFLGSATHRNKFYDFKRNEYFLDRHKATFEAVIGLGFFSQLPIFWTFDDPKKEVYENGFSLYRPNDIPLDIFVEELKFYRFPKHILIEYLKTEGIQCDIPPEGTTPLRYKIWHFLEVPKSSPCARYFHYFNTILIVISVFMFCFETLPVLRQNCSSDQKCTLDRHLQRDIT